jgi:hypothetical protein
LIVGQALRLPSDSATEAVALQLKSAHNHGVSEFQFGGKFVWWPSPELIAKSNLQQFSEKHRLGSYDELMRHAAARTGVTRSYQRNANARGLVGRAVLCTPLNSTANFIRHPSLELNAQRL